jgi:hypothetical protein
MTFDDQTIDRCDVVRIDNYSISYSKFGKRYRFDIGRIRFVGASSVSHSGKPFREGRKDT